MYYKNSYDSWSIGGDVEYMRGQKASAVLKVQYDPQVISLQVDHPTTNAKV